MLDKHLIAKTNPKALPEQIIMLENTRITVLTPELIRVERADDQKFSDSATQMVWYRNLEKCDYQADINDKEIVITTSSATFHYDRKKSRMDYVVIEGKKVGCNNKNNLKGTARTLDMTFGKIRLNDGIIGRDGVAIMVDDSLILDGDGMVKEKTSGGSDIYVFASTDYTKTLKAFFSITGPPPMVPRYALGNWWSRYHAYTQDGYLALLDKFEKENIPFSVATVDMDWHWVNIEQQFGKEYKGVSGWTGYSWNTLLFPDYRQFLKALKNKNMGILLNLHPAEGVRSYEDAYPAMCEAMGIDPATKQAVEFDFTDPKFINVYFSIIHRPYERDGVDAWWIDWQQGKKSKIKGYDPLWGLNHYHTLDNEVEGKRPMILSRYAGLGSHRYPLGFSGDTMVTWAALRFQPYFTSTATNAGYTAWSHDIGGHYFGRQSNQELYLRWLQFGVFSPIVRLHSSNMAKSKEPWNYPMVEDTAKDFLRLRHRLIPYIYSLYYRAYSEGRAICEPIYYNYPKRKEAYEVSNQYFFGSNLIVAPITSPINKKSKQGKVNVWLPKGRYTDFFTGEVYEGEGMFTMSRSLDTIPVLAREGAIIPLSNNEGNDISNPKDMDIYVYSGNKSFTLYEDDGETTDYKKGVFAKTKFSVAKKDNNSIIFTIDSVEGNPRLVPQTRSYNVFFRDITSFEDARVCRNGEAIASNYADNKFTIKDITPSDTVEIKLSGIKLI